MSGIVKYTALPPCYLPTGPVAVRARPGILEVIVDETQIDPLILPDMAKAGTEAIAPMIQLDEPAAVPLMECRIHRERDVPGGKLVVVDLSDHVADVYVQRDLMTEALAKHLGKAATYLLRHMSR